MKQEYRVYRLQDTQVCVPSEDYYHPENVNHERTTLLQQYGESHSSHDLALKEVMSYNFGEYVILPVIVRN